MARTFSWHPPMATFERTPQGPQHRIDCAFCGWSGTSKRVHEVFAACADHLTYVHADIVRDTIEGREAFIRLQERRQLS